MDNKRTIYLKNKTLLKSFQNAFNGVREVFLCERHMQIHSVAALIVIIAGIILKIDFIRWAVLILTIGAVLVSEILNTSIEKLTDIVTSEYSDEARKVKDIAASAVLTTAVISVIVGIVVFYRPIMDFIR